jgi:hypothetical protein
MLARAICTVPTLAPNGSLLAGDALRPKARLSIRLPSPFSLCVTTPVLTLAGGGSVLVRARHCPAPAFLGGTSRDFGIVYALALAGPPSSLQKIFLPPYLAYLRALPFQSCRPWGIARLYGPGNTLQWRVSIFAPLLTGRAQLSSLLALIPT